MTGVKAKSLREAKALDEDALGNYMKVLDGTKAITAAVVTKIFAKANGPASETVKKAKLTWMDGRDQGRRRADVRGRSGMSQHVFESSSMCTHADALRSHADALSSHSIPLPTRPLVRADSVLEHQDALDWPSDASADGGVDG